MTISDWLSMNDMYCRACLARMWGTVSGRCGAASQQVRLAWCSDILAGGKQHPRHDTPNRVEWVEGQVAQEPEELLDRGSHSWTLDRDRANRK